MNNSFATMLACKYRVTELLWMLRNGADIIDCEVWGLSEAEWIEHVRAAVAAKRLEYEL
jgi:hypothetical protein